MATSATGQPDDQVARINAATVTTDSDDRYVVTGTVSSPNSVAMGGLAVRLVDKNVGGDVALVSGLTDREGHFALSVSLPLRTLAARHKTTPDLQVQALQADTPVAASIVRYGASLVEELDVVLPATISLPSEYEALTTTLASFYAGSLADLEESTTQQDITYLANKSGWDARAVAMASLAAELSQNAAIPPPPPPSPSTPVAINPVIDTQQPGPGLSRSPSPSPTSTLPPPPPPTSAPTSAQIDPAFYYALFRAGLPTDAPTLLRANPDVVEAVWNQATSQGVIPASLQAQTAAARESFVSLASASALASPAAVGPSTLGDLLQVSFGNDTARQQEFANLLVRYQNDPTTLWIAVEKTFGTASSAQLQLVGQLAYLTVNNAPLIDALVQAEHQQPLSAPLDLVTRGYHEAAPWAALLANVDPPPEIEGATSAEKKATYAQFLAAQVRLSYPTATVAQLGTTGGFGTAWQSSAASDFLLAHQADFDIGDEPIARYLSRTKTTTTADVITQIGALQRVYQITPDALSLGTLMTAGLNSAYAIARMGRQSFVEQYKTALGGQSTAQTIFNRAQSIYASTVHIALSYAGAKRAPAQGSGVFGSLVEPLPLAGRLSPGEDGASAQATLESLFGNLDYCQCDYCQSITSPAAYLVDLLDYINNAAPTAPAGNPQAVLFARRPDIGALPLTCANTNTALPYVDLVNEALEYFVGNPTHSESLTGFVGYNTDASLQSAELIASPQNDGNATAQNAYQLLKEQWFPPPLPFYRDLELLRQHILRFQISLYGVMQALRTTESLESPNPADPNSYGWRDILAERLGLSRLEYRLLTDSTLTLAEIYGYPPLTDVIATMSPLQEYSRRTGVAYTDLVSILQTHFVNPNSALIPLLEALALPFSTLEALHATTLTPAAFTALLPTGLDPIAYGVAGPAAWVESNYAALGDLIVIDVQGDPCDTSQMQLQYLNGNSLEDVDFVRLLRFIRLWQKLQLTIQQTDDLISALYASSGSTSLTALQQLDGGFLLLLPRAGVAFLAADLLGLDPATDLETLLPCWGPISTGGTNSLYAQMFLNPTLLAIDGAFAPDVHGNLFTASPSPLLFDHRTALCAALNLTNGEFDLITGAPTSTAPGLGLGFDAATPLSLDAVSAIYRRAWLARTLQLSVLELISLISATGVDPFAVPVLDDTHPVVAPVLDFTNRVQSLSAASLAPVQALYLLWNIDLSGVSAPASTVLTGLAAALRAAFIAIDSQFTVTTSITPDAAKSLMAQVVGQTAANLFFALLSQSSPTSIPFGYAQSSLPADVITASSGRLSYDDLGKTLNFVGLFDPSTLAAMQALPDCDAALSAALAALQTAGTQAINAFFATYDSPGLGLQTLFNAFLAQSDPAVAFSTLLNGLLPVLGDLRKQEQALACATAAVGCDPAFAPALLNVNTVMPANNPPPSKPDAAAVADLTALGAGGLSVQLFLRDNLSSAPDHTFQVVPSLSYGPGNPLPAPLPPATAIAARWSGYLGASQDGDYNLRFTTDATSALALVVAGQPITLIQSGAIWTNQDPVSLQAGALIQIEITATGLTTTFTAAWATLGTGWQAIPAANLYSDVLVEYLRTTLLRFLKGTALATDLSLTASELAYLATAPELTGGEPSWLGGLAIDAPAPASSDPNLTSVLDGLLAFVSLKTSYAPASNQGSPLLTTLQQIGAASSSAMQQLQALTGWDGPSLQVLLPRLFNVSALSSLAAPLASLLRLQAAFALVTASRLSASTLIEAATNDPTPAVNPGSTVLQDFQSAVRSRYAEADWLTVIQPINDALRELQRDALVAYILVQSGVDILTSLGIATGSDRLPTADDLFNYFLLDVEMEHCMETSRIRQALSSVQLFIERCLRNLEPGVNPADIDGSQWDWRKRYRVWQANREVFLWPENWLDPSLRDDQSPFFKTAMSKLLQSDITDDTAVSAYLDYLSNLEGVAKLDPCGIYYQPAAAGTSDDLAHVVARTSGAHRKHYYRRLQGGSWTPWEEIKLTIEDNPVVPYVWNGRLLIFWLQLHHQSTTTPSTLGASLPQTPAGAPTLGQSHISDVSNSVASSAPQLAAEQVSAVLCFSEYYNGAWQPVKTSDVSNPLDLAQGPVGSFDRSSWFLRPWVAADASDDSLYVQITSDLLPTATWQPGVTWPSVWGALTGFVLHNTHSAPLSWSDVPPTKLVLPTKLRATVSLVGFLTAGPPNLVAFYSTNAQPSVVSYSALHPVIVLTGTLPQQLEAAQPDVQDQWGMPFFFGDSRSVFYVTTALRSQPFYRYPGYGLVPSTITGIAPRIPPIAIQPGPPQPGPPIEIAPGIVDPSIAQAAVTNTPLRAVISAGTALNFRGASIGVSGALPTAPQADANME